jgi:hypothetical protein
LLTRVTETILSSIFVIHNMLSWPVLCYKLFRILDSVLYLSIIIITFSSFGWGPKININFER